MYLELQTIIGRIRHEHLRHDTVPDIGGIARQRTGREGLHLTCRGTIFDGSLTQTLLDILPDLDETVGTGIVIDE